MPLSFRTIVDISLELDPNSYSMRTPAGFKKDMQFEMEVLKEHDAPGGAGQIVRGCTCACTPAVTSTLPSTTCAAVRIHQLPLELFMGDAVIADLRDKLPAQAITAKDLRRGSTIASARVTGCCCGPTTTTITTAVRRRG